MKDQHFMVKREILKRMVSSAEVKPDETILEIGGGRGILTEELSKKPGDIIVIEIDTKLAYSLRKKFYGNRKVKIIKGNALELIKTLEFDKIISNLPYSICEPLLKLLSGRKFKSAILTVPEKFFNRITEGRTKLSYFSRAFFQTEELFPVPREAFDPPPKTNSVVISLKPKKDNLFSFLFRGKGKMKLKNAMREYLIQKEKTTKKQANKSIKSLKLNNELLEKALNELEAIDFKEIESKTKSL
jgi:16S rRNA (adenine1518-N6/adenine1519-N6)-dimethyltransferase